MTDTTSKQHVTFEHLVYYDSRIKGYVDDIVKELRNESATEEDVSQLTSLINDLTLLVNTNTSSLKALRDETEENEKNIEKLFEFDKTNSLNIEELQTRIEFLATKEDVSILNTSFEALKDSLLKIDQSVANDHITIEELRISTSLKADKEYVDSAIANIQPVDLSGYYTKEEADNIYSGLVTKEEFDVVQQQSAGNNVKIFQIDEEIIDIKSQLEHIPSIEGLATEEYVNAKLSDVHIPEKISELYNDSGYITSEDIPDVSEFVTKEQLESTLDEFATETEISGLLQAFADFDQQIEEQVSQKADKSDIPTKVSQLSNDLGFLTSHQSLDAYATKDYVAQEILKAELGDTDFNAELYYTKSEVENLIPDVSNFATQTYVDDAISAIEHPTVDLTGYATETYVDNKVAEVKVPTKVSELDNDAGYITAKDVPSTEGLATKQELSEYAKKSEIPDVNLDGYATEEWVNNKGYLTEHQDITGKVDKSELESYAKKSDIPDVSEFVTSTALSNAVETKADNIVFTSDTYVTNPLGIFQKGESLKGLTIADILTRLLSLSENAPEEPEEPKTLVDKIISEEIPMYSVSVDGELLTTAFHIIDGETDPTESGFYVIKDASGKILEAGYQDIQVENDEIYYVIALSKEIDYTTMVDVQTYDSDEKIWVDADISLTSDPDTVSYLCEEAGIDITHIDTDKYTVWVQEDICTGSIIRYRIIEEN